MTDAKKAEIDGMSYEDMMRRNRFAPAGDPLFVGECGDYFLKVMSKKREEVGPTAHTAASKRIGWDG